MEHSDSTVLDLCVRKKPVEEYKPHVNLCKTNPHAQPRSDVVLKRPRSFDDTPTFQYSPVSNSDSEAEACIPVAPMTKVARPFKLYTKDLKPTVGIPRPESFLSLESNKAFTEFRDMFFSRLQTANNGTNKNMRRTSNVQQNKNDDPLYWEKRRKNNEAAKRSRDARRAKEDEIAIRCAFLEQENLQLKLKVATLETEREKMQDYMFRM